MRIAIDGPAGAGKSTVARALAERLGFVHLDTGAMYRAIALRALRSGTDLDDSKALGDLARHLPLRLAGDAVLLADEDVTAAIRTADVDRIVSRVASQPPVRAALVPLQRRLGAEGDVVADGRDIGTVVWPDAELKIFLTASLEERARRRARERPRPGGVAAVREEIASRDENDRRREVGPLRAAPDAVVVDTTDMSIAEVVAKIAGLVEEGRR